MEGGHLTHATVVHRGVVNPTLRLLNFALQVHGCLGRPAVGHSLVGLGLQVLQRRGNLLGQSPGLGSVTFAPARQQVQRKKQLSLLSFTCCLEFR